MWRVQETAAARSVVAWKSREPCPFNSGGKKADCVARPRLKRRRRAADAAARETRARDERGMAGRRLEPILSIERLKNYNGGQMDQEIEFILGGRGCGKAK